MFTQKDNQENGGVLKRISIDDLDMIQDLSTRSFYESFSSFNTKENMEIYMESAFSRSRLGAELSNPESQWYVYYLKEVPVGYIKVNTGRAQTEFFENHLEIERIYVLKEFQKQRIGHVLMIKAFDVARELSMNDIWLGVWEHNTKAIRFYKSFGFAPFTTHVFRLGSDLQTDILFRVRL